MLTRPCHQPRRVASVSQRVVRPYSLSAESRRANASAGAVVPRSDAHPDAQAVGRDEVLPRPRDGLARGELREGDQRAVHRGQRHHARLVLEIVAHHPDAAQPPVGGRRALLGRQRAVAAP